jgi:hypothetical protein
MSTSLEVENASVFRVGTDQRGLCQFTCPFHVGNPVIPSGANGKALSLRLFIVLIQLLDN